MNDMQMMMVIVALGGFLITLGLYRIGELLAAILGELERRP